MVARAFALGAAPCLSDAKLLYYSVTAGTCTSDGQHTVNMIIFHSSLIPWQSTIRRSAGSWCYTLRQDGTARRHRKEPVSELLSALTARHTHRLKSRYYLPAIMNLPSTPSLKAWRVQGRACTSTWLPRRWLTLDLTPAVTKDVSQIASMRNDAINLFGVRRFPSSPPSRSAP